MPEAPEDRPADAKGGDKEKPEQSEEARPDDASGDKDDAKKDDGKQAEQEAGRFRDLTRRPLDESPDAATTDLAAASRARSSARTDFRVGGDLQSFVNSVFHSAHVGNVLNLHLAGRQAVLTARSGAVPVDELRRLRRTYEEPEGYPRLRQALLLRRVMVLGAAPGTGRTTTALALLDDLTPRQAAAPESREDTAAHSPVRRIPPGTDLEALAATLIDGDERGVGFLLELPAGRPPTALPSEVHLDACAAALAGRDSYAILTVTVGAATAPLLAGRYGMPCPPAPTEALLAARLRVQLRETAPADLGALVDRGEELSRDPEVRAAVGLDDLRPSEVGLLSELLAEHLLGALSRSELLAACRSLAARQARQWYTGLDRWAAETEADPHRGSAAQVLYPAAFRIALAVLDGSAHSTVSLAAHALAWELSIESDPERTPARPLFSDDPESDLVLSRAAVRAGTVETAGVEVPAEVVGYRGDGLPSAVLSEVWGRHLAARAPIVRWLRQLADDPRPPVWVRAAVTVGELCASDFAHGYEELLRPLATATTLRRKLFAATALDQTARHDSHRDAVRDLVEDWAGSDLAALRWTAAMCLGYPRCAASPDAALDALAEIGVRGEGGHLPVASLNISRLAAGADSDLAVLRRLRRWTADPRAEHQDLGLVGIVRLALTEVAEVWDAETAADLEQRLDWPLPLALADVRPRLAVPLADLMWTALHTPRSVEPALDALEFWFRAAYAGDRPRALPGLAALLPQLVSREGDRQRIAWLIERMLHDPDRPISKQRANQLWRLATPPTTATSKERGGVS